MQVAILSARIGWHTDELCRALGERGHAGVVLPYEGLLARFGATTSLASQAVPLFAADLNVVITEPVPVAETAATLFVLPRPLTLVKSPPR